MLNQIKFDLWALKRRYCPKSFMLKVSRLLALIFLNA